jgi:hypothetical protein
VDIAQTWALLYVALYLVFEVTARSSDGSVNHGHHLVTLVAIVQCVAIGLLNAAEQWDWDVDRWVADTRGDTISWWSVQAILAVYVTSGLSKVLRDRGGWVHQSPGLLLNAAIRADMVDATGSGQESARASRARRIIFWLLPHANLTRVVFAGGLLVELAAPIGLFGEHALLAVGLALLVLHWGNGLLFNLPFVGYQILVVTYLINLPQFWS